MLVGDFSGVHGLSRGAAYDRQWLAQRHDELDVVDIGPALRGQRVDVDRQKPYGTVYLFCQPDTYSTVFRLFDCRQFARARRIGRWVWEAPIFPKSWHFALDLVHEIWTPSEFCAAVFRKATDVPVVVLPHHVPPPDPDTGALTRADLGIPDSAFVGLAIMDIQSCPARKNPWAHIEAWQLAFGDDPSAVLILKVRIGKRTRGVLRELNELASGSGAVRILSRDLDAREMTSLRAMADVHLSLHRSEGYGLNVHEALLTGAPVICSDWSAPNEYGPHFKNYIPVSTRLTKYRDWLEHYEEPRFCWADPDVPEAARRLGDVRSSREDAAKMNIAEASALIKNYVSSSSDIFDKSYYQSHHQRFQQTLNWLPIAHKGGVAIEIGKTPLFQYLLQNYCGFSEVWGTEFSQDPEKKNWVSSHCLFDTEIYSKTISIDIESELFPFRENEVDFIMCCEVIEHLDVDPMFMIAEFNRVLKGGGQLLITTPNSCSAQNVWKILHGYRPHFFTQYEKSRSPYRHNFEYDVHGLMSLMRSGGFHVERVESFDVFDAPHDAAIGFLQDHKFDSHFRGDDLFLLATKSGPVEERWPSDLYV